MIEDIDKVGIWLINKFRTVYGRTILPFAPLVESKDYISLNAFIKQFTKQFKNNKLFSKDKAMIKASEWFKDNLCEKYNRITEAPYLQPENLETVEEFIYHFLKAMEE